MKGIETVEGGREGVKATRVGGAMAGEGGQSRITLYGNEQYVVGRQQSTVLLIQACRSSEYCRSVLN